MLSFTVFTICLLGFFWTIIFGIKFVIVFEYDMRVCDELEEANYKFVCAMLIGALFGVGMLVAIGMGFWSLLYYPITMVAWVAVVALIYYYFV